MKYFIDCGTHLFQGLRQFNEIYKFDEDWEIYSFEANPITFKESQKNIPNYHNLNHYNKAVWVDNNGIYINIDENDKLNQGTNILENPPNLDIVYNNKFNWKKDFFVETFDFSYFIKNLRKNNKQDIIIKMDIEGSEFEILKKMIEEETFCLVNEYYIEFHERFFIQELTKYEQKKQDIINYANKNNIKINLWF